MAKIDKRGHGHNLAANFNHGSPALPPIGWDQPLPSLSMPPIGVFWDIENCQVPKGKSAMAVAQLIRKKFFSGYREAEFMCVCDISKENKEVIQELNNAQVTVVHINATCKNAADDKLRQSMRRFADIHGHPATIVLISGDVNFAADLSDFNHRRHLRVVVVHNNCAPEPLLACAHVHFNFYHLVAEIPFRTPSKQSQQVWELFVTNLPSEHNASQIRSRLKQLSDNCGGRVLGINHRTAVIRFPTSESAARAKKRMDREDVFGNKISVNFPPKPDLHENEEKRTQYRFHEENQYFTSIKTSLLTSYKESLSTSPSRHTVRKTIFPPPPSAPTVLMDTAMSSCSKLPYPSWNSFLQREQNLFGQRSASASLVSPQPSLDDLPQPVCFSGHCRYDSSSPQRYLHWKPLLASNRDEGSSDPLSSRCSTTSTCSSDGSRGATPAKCVVMDRPPEKGRRIRGAHRGAPRFDKDSSDERSGSRAANSPCRKKPSILNHQSLQERTPRRRLSDQNSGRKSTPSPNRQFVNSRYWTTLVTQETGSKSILNGANGAGLNGNQFATLPLPTPLGSGSPRSRSPLLRQESHFQPIDTSTGARDQAVELMVTNLDQSVDAKEMKKLLFSIFGQHVMVLHVSVVLNPEGSLSALVKVPSMQDAKFAISQLHRRKIGFKRILISIANNNSPALNVLRTEVIALLSDVPGRRLPLFKFRELFEKRYHQSIGASDLHKLKDVVTIQEEACGRMVALNPNYRETPSPASSEGSKEVQAIMEKSFCEIHCPNPNVGKGWAEKESLKSLPNFNISLKTLAPRVHSLLHTHNGMLPLGSFTVCYQHEFSALEVSEAGVPLEHLIAAIPGVQIGQSASGGKRVQWTENKPGSSTVAMPDMRSESPPLAAQLSLFTREVVDLLKNSPHCQMTFNKFIPAYHHHFGRQCRVADYGYTKLIDLIEAISHIIQILGEGNRRVLTLTHRSQIKRFTADLLRVLKSQASKQVTLAELSSVYEKCQGRSFDITNYGVCDVTDILGELSENTITVSTREDETIISILRREQTPDEVERTKHFATEVVELLRHSPQCRMSFNKFIPSYHHHFGQQCRVADYGFTKLIELFEAIPDVLEVYGEGDDKWLVLTERELLKVLSDQMSTLIRSTKDAALPLNSLLDAFMQHHGHSVNLEDYKVSDIKELLSKIKQTVKVIQTNEGPMVTLVDRGYVRQLSLNVRRLLMEQPDGKMKISEFCRKYLQRFDEPCNMLQVSSDLENVVQVEGGEKEGTISLVPLQMFARNVHALLHDCDGRILLHQFDAVYLERFGVQCRPARYGFSGLGALFQAIPDVAYVRGKGHKKVVLLNRETAGTPLYGIPVKKIAKPGLAAQCTNKAFIAKLDKRPSSADSAVVEEEEELLQIVYSPVDLLSDPVPSCVPSPSIQPCPLAPTEKDLIRFDSPLINAPDVITGVPDPGSMMTSKCHPFHDVSKQDLLATMLRTLALSTPMVDDAAAYGASRGVSVLAGNKVGMQTEAVRAEPVPGAIPNRVLPQQMTSSPIGTPVQLQIGLSHLDATVHSCEDLAACSSSDTSFSASADNTLTSSQSTPSKGRPRVRSRIAAHFTNPPQLLAND